MTTFAAFATDMELRNIQASIRECKRNLTMLESRIGDARSTILVMRKRRALLRVQLRRKLRQLEQQEAKLQ